MMQYIQSSLAASTTTPHPCSGIAKHRQISRPCKPQPSSGSECASAVPGIRWDQTANRANLPLPSWSWGPGRLLPYSSRCFLLLVSTVWSFAVSIACPLLTISQVYRKPILSHRLCSAYFNSSSLFPRSKGLAKAYGHPGVEAPAASFKCGLELSIRRD